MDTNNTTTTAASIAAGLSESEREALQTLFDADTITATDMWERLYDKKLVDFYTPSGDMLTPLGKQVLAALQPATEPAQAGGAGEAQQIATSTEKKYISVMIEKNHLEGELARVNELYDEAYEMNKAQRIERDTALAELTTLRTALAASESRLRQAEAALKEIRSTLSQICENETGGGDSCRYCGVVEIGLDKNWNEVSRGDADTSDRIWEFHINHEEWCPSHIIDKLFSGRFVAAALARESEE